MGNKLETFSRCCKPHRMGENSPLLDAGSQVLYRYRNSERDSFIVSDNEREGQHIRTANNNEREAPKRSHPTLADVLENDILEISVEDDDEHDVPPERKKKKRKDDVPQSIRYFGEVREKKKAPNYFVAFKVAHPEIRQLLGIVQQHVIRQDPRLRKCLVKLSTLHITLMVMHIETAEEQSRAFDVLKAIHSAYNEQMSRNPLEVEFKGLGHFGNKVLFANISPGDARDRLSLFAEDINRRYEEASIPSTDGPRSFNPHLTVMKLSKDPTLARRRVRKIDPSLYSLYENQLFGSQIVYGIQLLSMSEPLDKNGYYAGAEMLFDFATKC